MKTWCERCRDHRVNNKLIISAGKRDRGEDEVKENGRWSSVEPIRIPLSPRYIAKSNPLLPRLKLPRRILVDSRAKSVLLGRVLSFDPCWPIVPVPFVHRTPIIIRERGRPRSPSTAARLGPRVPPSFSREAERENHSMYVRVYAGPPSRRRRSSAYTTVYNGHLPPFEVPSPPLPPPPLPPPAPMPIDRRSPSARERAAANCRIGPYIPRRALSRCRTRGPGRGPPRCYVTRRSRVGLRAYHHPSACLSTALPLRRLIAIGDPRLPPSSFKRLRAVRGRSRGLSGRLRKAARGGSRDR